MAENTIEMKFRCPLEFVVEPEDVEKDCYEVSARYFAEYADEINKLIIESFGIYDPEECGLAAYIIDDDLAEKVISVIPSVESINGDLRGLMTVTLREELTEAETEALRKELIKQLDNGWGEDFSEETVYIGGNTDVAAAATERSTGRRTPKAAGGKYVYISFLCAKDGERLRVLNADEAINQAMGGIS